MGPAHEHEAKLSATLLSKRQDGFMTDDSESFLKGLPKTELHLHLEGSLEPEMLFALAERNGIPIAHPSVEALSAAYSFSRLQDFLDIYYQGMAVLRLEQDFHDLTLAYLRRAAEDGVKHCEVFFDPQVHLAGGVAFDSVIGGIHRAIETARQELGLTTYVIMCFLRHLDEADAERTLDQALAHKDKIIGVGLDSSENGHPPEKFRNVFRRAREEGFLLTAHAGEEGPPAYIWGALDVLGVDRIDHGVRALEDEALVARLARDQIGLTVCPLSNLRLRVVEDMRDHPLHKMMTKGLRVTVNSDDPAYFGGYINANYLAVRDALGLSEADIQELARNSFRASFLPEDRKQHFLRQVDRQQRA